MSLHLHSGVSLSYMLLVLLISGHLIADFLFQADLAEEFRSTPKLRLGHGAIAFLSQVVVLAAFPTRLVTLAVFGVATAHVVVDWWHMAWLRERRSRLAGFLADQATHLLVIVIVWYALVSMGVGPTSAWLSGDTAALYLIAVSLIAALAFNANGGCEIVEAVLELLASDGQEGQPADTDSTGRMIGILERSLILVLGLIGQWSAAILVLPAKSTARLEDLKDRQFAKYYLVGTLTSLLVAVLVTLLWSVIGGPLLLWGK